MELEFKKTERGFAVIEFMDRYGNGCSLQESSLATEREIWLGIDDAAPKIMASEASSLNIATEETTGWVPYPIPDAVLLHTRMHLTQDQVATLLPILSHFAETGELPMEAAK